MKTLLKIVFSLFVTLVIFIPHQALAEVIRSYDVAIVAHKDGTFDVTENIAYDFGTAKKHGIFRYIPLKSKVGELTRTIEVNLKSIVRNGKGEGYTVQNNGVQTTFKIGRADVEVTGLQNYIISYQVKNGIGSNYEDHDELYWNITGNGWSAPILKSSAKISTDFGAKPNRAVCYTGPQGSKDKNCDYSKISTITATVPLGSDEGLTAVWGFPKGSFPESILEKEATGNVDTGVNVNTTDVDPFWATVFVLGIFAVPIILNLIVAPWLWIWYMKNKNKTRFGSPSVNFDFPEDKHGKRITPAEAGSIDIHRVDQNDVIATIFDLAIRKYIKIEEIKPEKLLGIFGPSKEYQFSKLKDPNDGTNAFEKTILDRLFEEGDSVQLSSLNNDFYETFTQMEEEVFDSLIDRGFYTKNPKVQMSLLLVFGILVVFFGGILLGPLMIYLATKLNGRTALGDEVDWKLDGLKIFLKNMRRHHGWQAKNLITVEKYIPYAIAFGYIDEFMEQLKDIYPNYQPDWYSGSTSFQLASGDMVKTFSRSFTTTTRASSSSSGFSSGGSSGGGGGGGGGGSW